MPVFLFFHSKEKLLHTTFSLIRRTLSLLIAMLNFKISNLFRRQVLSFYRIIFMLLSRWLIFLWLFRTILNSSWLRLCLLMWRLLLLILLLWFFLACNTTHFINKNIESNLGIILLTVLQHILKFFLSIWSLQISAIFKSDSDPAVAIILIVIRQLVIDLAFYINIDLLLLYCWIIVVILFFFDRTCWLELFLFMLLLLILLVFDGSGVVAGYFAKPYWSLLAICLMVIY